MYIGLTFLFKGTFYSNNSAISIDEIPFSDLSCLTNLRQCCRVEDTNGTTYIRNWRFPKQDSVPTESNGMNIYMSRGPSAVILQRTMVFMSDPTGIYTCEIPDSNNANQLLYIYLYHGRISGRLSFFIRFRLSNNLSSIV